MAKQVMSAEGKARIVAAQRLRCGKQKAAATRTKPAAKKSVSAKPKKAVAKPEAAKKIAAKSSMNAEA